MAENFNKIEDTIEQTNIEAERDIVVEEALEAILFAAGHPINYTTLSRVFNMSVGKIKDVVYEYSIKYNNSDIPRGVILLSFQDSCQLCTKQQYLYEIRDALGIKKSGTLSTSALEVLAIVAYNQPVTRAFVDTLRRVDSSYAMNNLIDRGLIVSKGRLDVPGRPMLYGTTSDFLRSFGLTDLSSLPKTSDELIAAFEGAKSDEEEKIRESIEANSDVLDEQISVDIDSVMPTENESEAIDEQYIENETSAEDDITD
jgi:segregation and condensation protein B